MLTVDPKEIPVPKMHGYLLGAVAPRPVAFASTIDKAGNVNLSPFSFFNVFSANPPIMVFSPSRRVRDNTTKHTLENVQEVPEVAINIISYDMVQQASLASTEYPRGVNEFMKAGFTEVPSKRIRPPRVGESRVSFECKVNEIKPLGKEGGAGHLVICEVLLAHIKEEVLDADGRIDPYKLDAVARMGGDYYCRASGGAIFKVPKPKEKLGIGVDEIPEPVRNSTVLTGNDLGRLGNIERLPGLEDRTEIVSRIEVKDALHSGEATLHALAKKYIDAGNIEDAWKILLAYYD